jgi:hypothetical protein
VRIAVIYCLDDEHGGFSRGVSLLLVDILCDFDVKGIVVLWLRGCSGTSDERLELRSSLPISRGVGHSIGQERGG